MLEETIAHVPASEAVAAPTAKGHLPSEDICGVEQGLTCVCRLMVTRHGEAVFPRHI